MMVTCRHCWDPKTELQRSENPLRQDRHLIQNLIQNWTQRGTLDRAERLEDERGPNQVVLEADKQTGEQQVWV